MICSNKFLEKFIEKYILCPKCHYPELYFGLEGKKSLAYNCSACGNKGLSDTTNKAGAYMLKNPDKLRSSVAIGKHSGAKDTKTSKKKESAKEEEEATFKRPAIDSDEIGKFIKISFMMIIILSLPMILYDY